MKNMNCKIQKALTFSRLNLPILHPQWPVMGMLVSWGCLVRLPGRPSNRITWPRLTYSSSHGAGGTPPGYNPLWRGRVYCLVPEVSIFRRMSMGPEAFLGMPGMSGLWSRTRPILKRPCATLAQLVGSETNIIPNDQLWRNNMTDLSEKGLQKYIIKICHLSFI